MFPRKTSATPDDDLAFLGGPPVGVRADEVHISVTFTYDKPEAERLAESWSRVATVKIGGPAYDDRGGEFSPGMYVKKGHTITSRGCPNRCWFCSVPKREGGLRELTIQPGYNLLDSNILACSKGHIENVFAMMKMQEKSAILTGGLEAKLLTDWHVKKIWDLRPQRMFFAYDTPDDLEPLVEAGKRMRYADFSRQHLYCYVLIGYPKDDFESAEKRLLEAWTAGFTPMAMLWKNRGGDVDEDWGKFQRLWARPAILRTRMRDIFYKR